MKKKSLKIALIILTIIGCFTIVFAENMEDLQNKRQELQEQINQSNEQIEEIQNQITKNLEELNRLNEKINLYENDIKSLQKDLNKIEEEIKAVEQKLEIVKNNYESQKIALQNRILALYESGDILYLDVLLNSNNLSEFISNYFLIGEIARYDNNLLEDIDKQKVQIENTKEILKEKKDSLKELKSSTEKKTIALENAKTLRNDYINKLTDQEKETQSKIDEYQAELNRTEAEILAIATSGRDIEYTRRRIFMASSRILYNYIKIWA